MPELLLKLIVKWTLLLLSITRSPKNLLYPSQQANLLLTCTLLGIIISRACVDIFLNYQLNYVTPFYGCAGREPPNETGPKFNPFTGVARRLDGKPLVTQPAPVTSNVRTDAPSASGQASTSSSSSLKVTISHLKGGSYLVQIQTALIKPQRILNSKGTKQEQPKNEEPKFQAFCGKKYSLIG